MKNLIILLGSCALVAACGGGGGGGNNDNGGGGGGGGSPTTPWTVQITADNATKVAAEVFQTYDYLQYDLWFVLDGLWSGLTPQAANLQQSVMRAQGHVKRSLTAAASSPTARLLAAAPHTCLNNGIVTLDLGDTDNNGYLSQGETATYNFQNCEVDRGPSVILNGKATLKAITLSASNTEIQYTLDNFLVKEEDQSETLSGDITLVSTDQSPSYTDVLKGNSLTGTEADGSTTALSNYTATYVERDDENSVTDAFDDSMNSTVLGGSIEFKTTLPFKIIGENDYASSGSMTITGANSSSVKVTAESDGVYVDLNVDSNGDGTVDNTIRVTWKELYGD